MKIKLITIILFVLGIHVNTCAQKAEHIVILWDVTGSLLPSNSGLKDYDGSILQTYSKGNGMWMDLKKAVIECVEYAEEDPSNKITIVTFHDNIRDIFSKSATSDGKKELVEWVKKYKYEGHKYTNIVDPVEKFYTLLDGNQIKYMFLFTDGDNDEPLTEHQFIPTLDSWTNKTKGKDAYGFYVLVHPDADKVDIRNSIEKQDNFWIVPDAKVRIKFCNLPSSFKYNIRDEKGPKAIALQGNYKDIKGEIQLLSNDEFYDVVCSENSIKKGILKVEILPKKGKNQPEKHTIIITPQIKNSDSYTFVGPKQVSCEVSNLPERTLNLTIDDEQWSEASYYDSFCFGLVPESNTPIESKIEVDFSDQAKIEGSSAVMKVYLVDKSGEKTYSLSSKDLQLIINGEEVDGDEIILEPNMTELTLSILGKPNTESGKYYGRIELQPLKLDNYSINGSSEMYKWRFEFEHKWNPVKKYLTLLGCIILSVLLLWMIILRRMIYPVFGPIQKSFNIPGMAPLFIKFKGARLVVISSEPQKKQSWINCVFTGKIIYKIHPAFQKPIILKPSRGRNILAITQQGSYQISPNPMPGIGAATIYDIEKRIKIDVN